MLTSLAFATILFSGPVVAQNGQPQAAAEFAPQRAVWLSWPTYEHKKGVSIEKTMIEVMRELLKNVKVELLVPDDKVSRQVRAIFPNKNLNLRKVPYSEIWMRDFGPSFIGTGRNKTVLDFGFNYWGYEEPTMPNSKLHEQLDNLLAKQLRLPTRKSFTTGEGGNREANGNGVAMLVEEVELQRNPTLTRAELEERLIKTLGVEQIIWLKQGIYEDGAFYAGPIEGDLYLPATTGGHIDNIARFVDTNTIVVAEVTAEEAAKSKIAAINRERIEVNMEILTEARDNQGNSFKIVRMPAADLNIESMNPGDPIYDFLAELDYRPAHVFPKGKTIRVAHAASYLNFLLTNNLVLTSKLYVPGAPIALKKKDADSVRILKELFPNRRVVAIETRSINLGGGGIHCIASHEPE